MANLIIVEGIPGSGKSTLINRLVKQTQLSVFARPKNIQALPSFHPENEDIIKQLSQDTIFDRFIWSDVVFSKVRHNLDVTEEFFRLRELLMKHHQYILIYMHSYNPIQTHSSYSNIDLAAMRGVYDWLIRDESTIVRLTKDNPSLNEVEVVTNLFSDLSKKGL